MGEAGPHGRSLRSEIIGVNRWFTFQGSSRRSVRVFTRPTLRAAHWGPGRPMLEPPETSGGRALGPLTAALFAGLVAAVPAHALTAVDCANLTNATVPNTTITRASLVPARGGVPEYCKVSGHVERDINFEL